MCEMQAEQRLASVACVALGVSPALLQGREGLVGNYVSKINTIVRLKKKVLRVIAGLLLNCTLSTIICGKIVDLRKDLIHGMMFRALNFCGVK